jgi:hypothetical protein
MCDHIIVLARLDHRRWLSCCEHGTTHLNWDSVSLRLRTHKLNAMGKALQECAQVAHSFRIASKDEVCVVFDQYDLYQVWFGGVGVCLSQKDFQLFCQLVDEARTHPMTLPGCHEEPIGHPEPLIHTTYHLFSVN